MLKYAGVRQDCLYPGVVIGNSEVNKQHGRSMDFGI